MEGGHICSSLSLLSRRVEEKNPSFGRFFSVVRAQNAPVAVPRASGIGYAPYRPKAVKRAARSSVLGTPIRPGQCRGPRRRTDARMAELGAAAVVRSMLLPTKVAAQSDTWETFTDPATGCSYQYNPSTGESRWAGSAAEQARAALRGERPVPSPRAPAPPIELEMVSPTSADVFRQSDFDDGEIYKDDKAEDAALARNWKKKGMLRTVERHRRTKLEGCDRVCDRIALVCEVACCEQPAACLEALCRCPGYLLGSLLLYVLSVLVCVSRGCDCDAGGRVSAKAGAYLREGCLFLASALSLLVPGMAFVIYRNMPLDDDSDWCIRPLPTIIGHVDPRRFWAFSLGRCALADDGFYDAALGSLDSWKGPILHPPRTEAPASLGFFDEFGDGSSDDEDDRRGESVV